MRTFISSPVGKRVRDFVWEVAATGKGDSRAAARRRGPCAGLLGVLRLCSGHAEPLLQRCSGWVSSILQGAWGGSILILRQSSRRPAQWGFSDCLCGDSLPGPGGWANCRGDRASIALLIFVLMATYLAAFFVPGATVAGRALWWAHTLSLLVFLPLIPHTKHLHLVLSPFTVFLSRGGFARIPPLAGDEDFGLVAGKDLTQLVSLQAYSCVECGRCMEHCPANNTGKLLNPKEIVLGLRGYLNEFGPGSDEPLLGKYNSQEAAFECTTCGACEFQCPVGIEHVPIIVGPAARRGQHWRMGRQSRREALSCSRTRQQRAGPKRDGARQVHREECAAHLRRNARILFVARLHGRLRSARPRDCAGSRARDAASRRHLRRSPQRKVHRRSGAAPGQRSALSATGRSQPRSTGPIQNQENNLDLSRIACAPFKRTGRTTERPRKSSTTASFWPDI